MRFESKQLTPRQGTKTHRSAGSFPQHLETTYTPSGDENVVHHTPQYDFLHETTHTPSGDENTHNENLLLFYFTKQLTPRQGTKTRSCKCRTLSTSRNNLHPVRGRKQKSANLVVGNKRETTYTPSGDENCVIFSFKSPIAETTYTPPGDENAACNCC